MRPLIARLREPGSCSHRTRAYCPVLFLQSRTVKVPIIASTTFAELKELLTVAFELPVDASLRLLLKGKTVSAEASSLCEELGLKAGATIMVMHSKQSEIEAIQTAQPERMRGFEEDDQRRATGGLHASAGSSVVANRTRQSVSSYRFHELRPLTKLPPGARPDESACRKRLVELSEDRAILKILDDHKWSIGALSEMPPEGLVGVSASCLMGLNKNKGEEILLRLRTDDWNGLRPYLSVIDVLLHELAHCVHGDHDDDFKALWALLKLEYSQHRSREQRGHSTAGTDVYQPQTDYGTNLVDNGHTLGGSTPVPNSSPAMLAAVAATSRANANLNQNNSCVEERRSLDTLAEARVQCDDCAMDES